MTSLNDAVLELRLAVAQIAQRELPPGAKYAEREDLRTEALVTLLDALDRIDPGLGELAMAVLYPGVAAPDALVSGGQLGRRMQ